MAGRHAARDRIMRALWSAGSTTARSFARVLRLLFLQVTGTLFLFLAVVGGGAAIREYYKYRTGTIGPEKALLGACFALMFLWFAITSFWRARRKSIV
jgi:predicted lysophospholipase L1 biosynthesis ABC-type transport system permease subunit